jgi:DNA-binding protein H-NS
MSAMKIDFESMSLDDLWSLHAKISAILSARIRAEKLELEKRLALLNRGIDLVSEPHGHRSISGKQRRRYPRVLPKYKNPQTSETWSGRGKRPRWLVAAVKSGHKIEEYRIEDASATKARRRA